MAALYSLERGRRRAQVTFDFLWVDGYDVTDPNGLSHMYMRAIAAAALAGVAHASTYSWEVASSEYHYNATPGEPNLCEPGTTGDCFGTDLVGDPEAPRTHLHSLPCRVVGPYMDMGFDGTDT